MGKTLDNILKISTLTSSTIFKFSLVDERSYRAGLFGARMKEAYTSRFAKTDPHPITLQPK
jgi:hypothetical protein